MNHESTPLVLLKRRNRQQKWMVALTVATIGLALSLALFWALGDSDVAGFKDAQPQAWLASLALTACAALAARWLRKGAPEETARELDQCWSAKNRLEAACELRDAATPLAEAQLAETERYLTSRPAVHSSRLPLWPVAAATALLLLLHGGTGIYWLTRPEVKVAVEPPAPVTIPTAEIIWKLPKSEIKATKIEEVPLSAEIRSDSGVRDFALEISVNGEPKKTVALPAEPFAKAGSHPLDVSIYLDEIGVEPFDIVSYDLRAHRNHSSKLPATVSALQFIQIRPFREDATKGKGGGGSCECLDELLKIKVGQLTAMKQNFVLANSELPPSDAAWQQENQRVGEDQRVLATKTEEVSKIGSDTGWPAALVDVILQAKPEMDSASQLVLAVRNTEAVRPQGKALAFITAAEKYLRKALAERGGGNPKPKLANPFADEQQFKLEPREQTPAGGLEKAARAQSELLAELNARKDSEASPDEPAPELTKKQIDISQTLAQLKNNDGFGEEVRKGIGEAHKSANESVEQLEARDAESAREPAARTLAHLQSALAAMKAASEREAAAALAQAQRELNEASSAMKGEKGKGAGQAGTQVAETREDLRDEAGRQQEHGSAAAAQQLAKIAKEIEEKKVLEDLQKLEAGKPGDAEKTAAKIEELAQRAAAEQLRLAHGKEALA
nr:hypothetical protein [Verrucomicrobiota bacterium]